DVSTHPARIVEIHIPSGLFQQHVDDRVQDWICLLGIRPGSLSWISPGSGPTIGPLGRTIGPLGVRIGLLGGSSGPMVGLLGGSSGPMVGLLGGSSGPMVGLLGGS